MSGEGFRQQVLAFFRRLRGIGGLDVRAPITGEELRRRLIALFRRLRAARFNLGLAELLDAMELLESGLHGDAQAQWQADLRLLCCRNRDEIESFNRIWAEVWQSEPRIENPPELRDQTRQAPAKQTPNAGPNTETETRPKTTIEAEPEILPVLPPPVAEERRDEMTLRFPLTRREMAYGWRQLRLPVPDGPADVLDVAATVERTARQGFFFAPVFGRRRRNHAHLILLVDQGGSMTPFHRFTRDLIETAFEQINASDADTEVLPRVQVFYFHNQMAEHLHHDAHLTDPVEVKDVLADCDDESCVLVVSDAGAARGYRRRERIRAAGLMVNSLRKYKPSLAWLNPMPASRWRGASAEVIAELVPMFPMTPDGFSNTIDVLRGLS